MSKTNQQRLLRDNEVLSKWDRALPGEVLSIWDRVLPGENLGIWNRTLSGALSGG